jgi:hypothetical protein
LLFAHVKHRLLKFHEASNPQVALFRTLNNIKVSVICRSGSKTLSRANLRYDQDRLSAVLLRVGVPGANIIKATFVPAIKLCAFGIPSPAVSVADAHRGRLWFGMDGRATNERPKIDQLVYYLGREAASGVYQVTQLLPPEGEAFQYRIKNANEPHERMAKEHELFSAA